MDYIEGKLLISDEIYNKILERISDGRWGVGQKLPSEKQLCEMFEASRVSVRAALHKLQANDLIITRQGVGSIVKAPKNRQDVIPYEKSDISEEAFIQFTEFRKAIEFKAVDLLIANLNEERIAAVTAAMRDLETRGPESAENLDLYDFQFHMAIINHCGNQFISGAMEPYQDFFLHYVQEVHRMAPVPSESLLQDHRNMLRSILEGKPNLMRRILLEDILMSQKTMFRDL
ncbi:MAG: FadR family transcriptional regulator [Oscillibacter sp.]|jgi:GntR family transcriptional repressor for pyruvate dehydrogenase complex|nr:FadR family transcriptional regulator [Oscillibacter sp.]MCI8849443.1 FadR family transcriptional regulator [Oscillibacter sp.]